MDIGLKMDNIRFGGSGSGEAYQPSHRGEADVRGESLAFLNDINAGRITSIDYAAYLITRQYGPDVSRAAMFEHLTQLKDEGVEGVVQ